MTLAAATLLAACSQDDMEQNESDNAALAVQFSAGNLAAVQTRTTIDGDGETQWSEADAVGIFMTGTATADNMKYTVSNATTGALEPDGASNTLYYPQGGGNVNFIAYYPWKDGQALNNYYVDVSNQSNPADIDLLYSNNATDYSKTSNGAVGLTFHHVLARLKMKIVAGNGFADMKGLTVTIQNVSTTANFNLSNNSISVTNNGESITPRNTGADDDDVLCELILIPAQYTSGKVVFTVSGVDYFWDISAIEFQSGKQYSYEITINKAIGITVTGGATWDSGNTYDNITGTSSIDIVIQYVFAVATGAGTLEDPKQVIIPPMEWNAELKTALESELASCYASLDLSALTGTGITTWDQDDVTLKKSVHEKIVNLVLPNSVTTIGGASLRTASQYGAHYINLKTVSGTGVTTIATDAFNGQHEPSSLTAVNFPNVTRIEGYVFINCTQLQTVSLPSLQSAGYCNFQSTGLQPLTIVLGATLPTFGDNSFSGAGAKPVTVKVPAESIGRYDTTWQNQLKNGNSNIQLTIIGE